MKKKYINPEIKVIKIDTCSLMQLSGDHIKSGDAKGDLENLARENSFFWEEESLEEE